jgi:curved DNA-binding protein CbpA
MALQTHPDRLPQGASDNEIKDAAERFRKVNSFNGFMNSFSSFSGEQRL